MIGTVLFNVVVVGLACLDAAEASRKKRRIIKSRKTSKASKPSKSLSSTEESSQPRLPPKEKKQHEEKPPKTWNYFEQNFNRLDAMFKAQISDYRHYFTEEQMKVITTVAPQIAGKLRDKDLGPPGGFYHSLLQLLEARRALGKRPSFVFIASYNDSVDKYFAVLAKSIKKRFRKRELHAMSSRLGDLKASIRLNN